MALPSALQWVHKLDLVVELDKYWGVDYDKMRTFFVDTVSKYHRNLDAHLIISKWC